MPDTVVQVTLPEMGESVTEGSIVEWRKRVGDFVSVGDPLVDVTTDKVDVEVPATASGVVVRIAADEGQTVAVGSLLAEIDTSQAASSNGHASASSQPPAPPAPPAPSAPAPRRAEGAVRASAQARRVAAKREVDLALVRGSGPSGLILRADVTSQAAGARRPAGVAPPSPPVPQGARVTPLRGPAAALVGYMDQSLTIPTATSFRTFVVAVLDARRKELGAALKAAGRAEKVSFTHLIAFALVRAAAELPWITYSFRRDGDQPARLEPGIHLGLAVDAQRKDGTRFLIVPVIKAADTLDFAAFRLRYEELVTKARENKLGADDLQGASFTLTNPGGIGTVASVPRLMAGQGAILAAGAIGYPSGFTQMDEATLRALGVSKIMQMTSTYDHRVIQGAQSGEYLRRIDELLQGKDGFYEAVFSSLNVPIGSLPARTAAALPAVLTGGSTAVAPSDEILRAVAAGMAIVAAYRTHGHLAASLDPLGSPPPGDPSLDPAHYGLTPALQSAIPAPVLRTKVPGHTLADVLPRLREIYSSTIAYEVEHISNTEQREWLRTNIESGAYRTVLSGERALRVLERLTRVDAFDRYIRKTFMGQKTFSGEGLDVMVPMLEEALEMLADGGVADAVIGMAHRGRLNVIAHVVNSPYEEVMTEFEAAQWRGEVGDDDLTGDVKYHHGATGTYNTANGKQIAVTLAHNPSHLEAVDPVVEGSARALQTDRNAGVPRIDLQRAAPILIHGDAAFVAQGVVAEVLNLQSLPGYETGGTLHIIANNQIGFTTDPHDGRSTRYASDPAKGFDVPIVHVNADDVDACIAAVHLAVDFRTRFGSDVLIDLIGYRRFGHNEQDEPAYTQPAMAEKIKAHPTVRELFANKLIAQGVLSAEDAKEMADRATARLQEARKAVKGPPSPVEGLKLAGSNTFKGTQLRRVERAQLVAWTQALAVVPEGFTIHKKLVTQFERRAATVAQKGIVDWGTAEALAFASVLTDGTPVRLTGQDTQRGTFSHRHAVLHDPASEATWIPLQHLPEESASFEIYNAPLSEYACMGYEYGYSTQVPDALVLWEAQYGDFFNGAQIIVDQFIASGHAKWGQTSRLVLLLPHGYEGSGPEHSSARLERFLQLVAEGNLRVAYPSVAGNYYHLLRLQAKAPLAVPMVVMTPKSLLRAESAAGNLDEMATGEFAPVIDDPRELDRKRIERVLLCTGKIYHDLAAHEAYANLRKTAIVRIELLAPLPTIQINGVLAGYPNAKTLVWVQEEPKNMGARAFVRRRLLESKKDGLNIGYIGRGYRASTSEGYAGQHAVEQERILAAALAE
ncbi:MAG: multifunctional oxoglutarate decarboxylase/oxoglutarate dehydrogenase thiamine pyrophosphate-binding subunit/dihydrolipoyllysine-residue succinyltransferase subunit [Vulcanimicrobiaceae bacterium]